MVRLHPLPLPLPLPRDRKIAAQLYNLLSALSRGRHCTTDDDDVEAEQLGQLVRLLLGLRNREDVMPRPRGSAFRLHGRDPRTGKVGSSPPTQMVRYEVACSYESRADCRQVLSKASAMLSIKMWHPTPGGAPIRKHNIVVSAPKR